MGKRFFVSCREDSVESAIQEFRRRGCIMVTRARKAHGRPGVMDFVVQSPSERAAWLETVDGVVDVHADFKFDLD